MRLVSQKEREKAAAELERVRRLAPARVANKSRNANAGPKRHRRWEAMRDALWDFIAPVLDDGARVAIVGAGNCDTVPLPRIVAPAGAVALIDIDRRTPEGARRRLGRRERRMVEVIGHDVTGGVADAIAHQILGTEDPEPGTADRAPRDPLPGAPYDLVIGDLFYSQLLYPALLDLEIDGERIDAVIAAEAPALTAAVVARMHASAPVVVHIHDPLAWWEGHEQPVALEEVLALAGGGDLDAALALVARGNGPKESDPRAALADLGLSPAATALWPWPFTEGVDYLACATLART
jgi:hypothetical protein